MTDEAGLPKRVIVEGNDLTLASGTGIATYARQLGTAARSAGFTTELLVGSSRGLDQKDATLAEVTFFDADRKSTWLDEAGALVAEASILPFAAKPIELPAFQTVSQHASDRFSAFDRIHAITHLTRRERHYFKRYRRRLPVAMRSPPRLFHSARPAPIALKGCPNIYTIHDIVPLRLPFATLDNKKYFLNVIRELCRVADHIVTVSEFSRRDIMRLTGIEERRISNTYQAVRLPERLMTRDETAISNEIESVFGLEFGNYFLFVGALEPKKNVGRLIDAYAASGVTKPLVIAGGPGWLNDGLMEKLNSEQFLSYRMKDERIRPERSVRRLSYLPLDHLVSLIRGARALLFPSIYEGFGLPVLEAMLLGTPVMTSNVSSLPEIAGEAARIVDPYDIEAMALAIRELDRDDDLCSELSRRGKMRAEMFSPAVYSERVRSLYDAVV
ncbi:MAG: glycosyltransferase family 4 protein [Hyphomicrobiaceae bacterium]